MMFRLRKVFSALLPATSALAVTYRGADFSSLPILEADGQSYSDGGTTQALETILANYGTNLARIRVWAADDSDYNLADMVALGVRANAAGMDVMVDLHYSDTWADPGKQGTPAGWATDLSGLDSAIYDYTLYAVQEFVDAGVTPAFVQIGNEINDGMLWPAGQISENGYEALSELLHSASTAVREASSSTKIVVHLANGWDGSAMSSFYDQIFIQGAFDPSDFDVMAFSMYPFYNSGATLASLQGSLSTLVSSYNKDIFLVETDWPVDCSDVTLTEPDIPKSVDGQVEWVNDLRSILDDLAGGHGLGFVYWEPAWIGNGGLGSSCADNLLVEYSGAARSSMSMFSA
ncbi:glycoside hydrolase family 53 protein [Cylindrobasidium torrendii FP15055 ss-10]|uniref:Arabinogalactan endo-beta-1,4-galactanase n=1 Tax=Cylindrobasidium torrendii FP15055 ss-10 TaxID=1314674 RepID=A0A0D7BSQ2_9AGAR|nr:glycoside hydrolase family 53 protein [Cylindrobasidium torrendii FP15055 ss-10]